MAHFKLIQDSLESSLLLEHASIIAELDSSQAQENVLDLSKISSIFHNTTTSYKFWWFFSLLQHAKQGEHQVPLNQVLLDMIYYSLEPLYTFHLSFGVSDRLPRICNNIILALNQAISDAHTLSILNLDNNNNSASTTLITASSTTDTLHENLSYVKTIQRQADPSSLIDNKLNLAQAQISLILPLKNKDFFSLLNQDNLYALFLPHLESNSFSSDYLALCADFLVNLLRLHKGTTLPVIAQDLLKNHKLCLDFAHNLQTIAQDIKALAQYVPARLLNPWICNKDAELFNQNNNAPYYVQESLWKITLHIRNEKKEISQQSITLCNKTKTVFFSQDYFNFFHQGSVILEQFTWGALAKYLEGHNPLVPAILRKLTEGYTRQIMTKQHKFFDCYLAQKNLTCIYDQNICIEHNKKYELDHFIPWSFVLHNQIWNLTPISASLNSQKSDSLPLLHEHIEKLAKQHQELLTFHLNRGYRLFKEECKQGKDPQQLLKKTVHNQIENYLGEFSEIGFEYYSLMQGVEINLRTQEYSLQELVSLDHEEFCQILFWHIEPAYQIARQQGFPLWNLNTIKK